MPSCGLSPTPLPEEFCFAQIRACPFPALTPSPVPQGPKTKTNLLGTLQALPELRSADTPGSSLNAAPSHPTSGSTAGTCRPRRRQGMMPSLPPDLAHTSLQPGMPSASPLPGQLPYTPRSYLLWEIAFWQLTCLWGSYQAVSKGCVSVFPLDENSPRARAEWRTFMYQSRVTSSALGWR